MIITFTKFNGATATSKIEIRATLEQIRDGVLSVSAPSKAELPWIKLATFGDNATAKGSLRHDANVNIVFGVEGDYDSLDMSPQTAVALLDLAGIHALVYTSPSYTPDGPKWRVLCPLAKPCLPADRKALVAKLNGALGGVLARESFVLSQSFYYGRVADNPYHEAWIVDGQCIDEVGGLEEVYPQRIAYRAVHVPTGGVTSTDTGKDALRAACESFARPDADGQRHQYILAATAFVAPYIKAGMLDETEATEAIREACVQSGREPHPDETEDALHRAVAYVDPWKEDPIHEWTPAVEAAREMFEAEDGGIFVNELTEDAVALEFANRYAERFRFDHTAGGKPGEGSGLWFQFIPDEGWTLDKDGSVTDEARTMVRRVRKQRAFHKDTLGAASDGFRKAVVRMSRDDKRMAITNDNWDSDPWVLGVKGGQVDLRTGVCSPTRPDYLIRLRTSVAPAPPGTPTPIWTRYLHEATGGDVEFIAWLQRLTGYFLTGDVSEEIFCFVYGPGGSGKGTFLSTIERIMGMCAYKAPKELFQAEGGVNREYQFAELDRVRLIFSSETEQGKFMAEALVKELTGNEGKINARHIYGAPFSFTPQCKLIIVGNFAPKLTGRDAAMERRMRVAPFNRIPANRDDTLKDRLTVEYPAILRWMLDGCQIWQRQRLGMCAAVSVASRSYFEDQDNLSQWVSERCDIGKAHVGSATGLLEDYNTWLRTRGEKPTDSRSFKQAVKARMPDIEWDRHRTDGMVVRGVMLRVASQATNNLSDIL